MVTQPGLKQRHKRARRGSKCAANCSSDETQAQPDSLRALGKQIRAAGVWPVYSTPATLFDETGALDEAAMTQTLAEAEALGARIVKFQLGGSATTGTATDAHTLDRLVAGIAESKAQRRGRERPTESGRH